MGAPITAFSALIASGGSLSGAIDLGDHRLFAIQMPASWTTAGLTFQASYDGVTFADVLESEATEVAVSAAASKYIVIQNPARWLGIRYLKIRSGTSASAVNQGAERTLQVIGVG